MDRKISSSLAQRLGDSLSRYQAAVDDFDREMARILEVNATDLRCLESLLRETAEASPGELAQRLGLTTGSVTPMLDRLERLGYLARGPHPSDRRRTVIHATAELAKRVQPLIGPLVAEGAENLAAHYSPEQLELICTFVAEIGELQQRHVDRLRAMNG